MALHLAWKRYVWINNPVNLVARKWWNSKDAVVAKKIKSWHDTFLGATILFPVFDWNQTRSPLKKSLKHDRCLHVLPVFIVQKLVKDKKLSFFPCVHLPLDTTIFVRCSFFLFVSLAPRTCTLSFLHTNFISIFPSYRMAVNLNATERNKRKQYWKSSSGLTILKLKKKVRVLDTK